VEDGAARTAAFAVIGHFSYVRQSGNEQSVSGKADDRGEYRRNNTQEGKAMLRYRITELPPRGGRGCRANCINNRGLVAGDAEGPGKEFAKSWQATFWSGRQAMGCEVPASRVLALNNRGTALCGVFGVTMESRYFLWDRKRVTYLKGKDFYDTNDANVLVGAEKMPDKHKTDGIFTGNACVWEAGTRRFLPVPENVLGSEAYGINNRGTIVGCITRRGWEKTGRFIEAVLWRGEKMITLPTPREPWQAQFAQRILDDDTVIGNILYPDRRTDIETIPFPFQLYPPDRKCRGFIYRAEKMTLLPMPTDGISHASGINVHHVVVGWYCNDAGQQIVPQYHACLWLDGRFYDLASLLVDAEEWQLETASGINDRGQIVGNGAYKGQQRGYRLDPVA
jgi:hypothetical protein